MAQGLVKYSAFVMNKVRSSLTYSALNSYSTLLLQIISTVIIARLLTPEQTGVFAVAAVFAALASTFRDFGIGEYLIQEKEITDETLRAALAVNIAISWIMAAALFAAAPFAGRFYGNAGVTDVMRVQSISFLLIPFGAITMAWFRREMNFRPILISGIAANVVGFAVSVSMAFMGYGYMSLAWASVAGVVVTVAVSFAMRPAWFPHWPALKGAKRIIHFGKFASFIYIFGQAGNGAPELIIGRASGMAGVGMFSRAAGLVEIFNHLVLRAVMLVCLPYLAAGARAQGSVVPALKTMISYLTVVGWPFLLFLGLAAYPAIRLLYGPQWVEAVSIAQILCAAAAVELLFSPSRDVLLALGKPREAATMQGTIQGLRVIGLLAAVPLGLVGAAWGLLLAAVGGLVFSRWYLGRHAGLLWRDWWHSTKLSALMAGLSTAPAAALLFWMPPDETNYILLGVGAGLTTAVLWLGTLRALKHPLWAEVVRMKGWL